MTLRLVALLVLAGHVPVHDSTPEVDFARQVWPILEERCIECHSSPERTTSGRLRKPKAGVQLDSPAGIRSSQRGSVVVAGRPEASLLYERIRLPRGDEDIMPPARHGEPLTKAQTDLIRRWITEGASYGTWRGVSGRTDPAAGAEGARKRGGRDPRAVRTSPPITALAFAPDGKSLVACSQEGLRVYGWPSLQLQQELAATAHNLHDLALSPRGDRLAVAGGDPARAGLVEILSWPGRELQATVRGQSDSVHAVGWRDDSTIALASLDHSILLADTSSGETVGRLTGHSRGVRALCFLRGGETLVSAGIDQSVRVWNVPTEELVRSMNQHTGPVHDLALRPGKSELPMVASAAGDRTIRFWQPSIGRMVRYVRLASPPLDIAWLPDGARIVASCSDGRVRVVDAETVQVVADLQAIGGPAYSVAVHPTDASLVVGGKGGELRRVGPR